MCGIGGIWHRRGGFASHDDLRRMMSAMHHRGPEGAAFSRLDEGSLLLGFLLLGFTGEGRATQPLYNEDYTVGLVYNGEIYDYAALRARLLKQGHRFRGTSDSEVIIHLYEQDPRSFYEQLNGEFSFVLWDSRREELLLVRDRYGVKPLHYGFLNGGFVFASEAKGLHALSGFPVALDPNFWAGPGVGVADNAATAFTGIASVRPGHLLRVGRDSVREERWYTPRFERKTGDLRATLTRAVQRRLEGDPPIALSLSSGIDSTIIAALMAESGQRFTAFSIGYDNAPYDESAVAAETAKYYGIPFERVRCSVEAFVDTLVPGVRSVEVGTNSLSTTARLALTKAVRGAGFKALMTGEGSDELFGGYPYFGIEAIWRAKSRAALATFRADEARSRNMFWKDVDDPKPGALGYACAYELHVRQMQRSLRWIFARDFRAAMRERPEDVFRRETELARGLDPFNATRMVSRSMLGSLVIPSLGDRVEMAHSLEGRAPYLDRDVIALAHGLSQDECIDPVTFTRKRALREAFADRLPPAHRAPPKHTQMAPMFADMWRLSRGRALLETYLCDRAIKRAGIFDPLFVRLVRSAWRAMPTPALDRVLGFIATTQILEAVFVQGRAAAPTLAMSDDRSPPVKRARAAP